MLQEHRDHVILGIDPGSLMMGYCVIHAHGNKLSVGQMDVLKLSPRSDNYKRLQLIHAKVTELIAAHRPDCCAIEAPFFGKNVQSMLKLGRAQGVAIAAAISGGLEVTEYSPSRIKQSITGSGNAGKDQVWKMLQQILLLQSRDITSFDASDALAVAVCHHFQQRSSLSKLPRAGNDWKTFIARNPHRLG